MAKGKQQMAYFAKLAEGKNTASPEYWKNKTALPVKQERRQNFKIGGGQDIGKQSICPKCRSQSYGKHHRGKGTFVSKYCKNCAYGAEGRGWV